MIPFILTMCYAPSRLHRGIASALLFAHSGVAHSASVAHIGANGAIGFAEQSFDNYSVIYYNQSHLPQNQTHMPQNDNNHTNQTHIPQALMRRSEVAISSHISLDHSVAAKTTTTTTTRPISDDERKCLQSLDGALAFTVEAQVYTPQCATFFMTTLGMKHVTGTCVGVKDCPTIRSPTFSLSSQPGETWLVRQICRLLPGTNGLVSITTQRWCLKEVVRVATSNLLGFAYCALDCFPGNLGFSPLPIAYRQCIDTPAIAADTPPPTPQPTDFSKIIPKDATDEEAEQIKNVVTEWEKQNVPS